MKLNISVDLDETIFDWNNHYVNRFGIPKDDYEITKNVTRVLSKDKDFWLTQPIKHTLNFIPKIYCTARSIPKNWIKEQLEYNNLPKAPVYQLYCYTFSKVPKIKMAGCNLHIDDSIRVFIDCNLNGVPCLLIDSENNKDWGPIGRIYNLDYNHILETYCLFRDTMFNDFKELVNEYRSK